MGGSAAAVARRPPPRPQPLSPSYGLLRHLPLSMSSGFRAGGKGRSSRRRDSSTGRGREGGDGGGWVRADHALSGEQGAPSPAGIEGRRSGSSRGGANTHGREDEMV
ncbi:unnamed protein product [Urochloa humidicola]